MIGPADGLIWIIILLGQLLYYLPSIIAMKKRNPSILTVFLCNLFLGWTTIGWIIILIGVLREKKHEVKLNDNPINSNESTSDNNFDKFL